MRDWLAFPEWGQPEMAHPNPIGAEKKAADRMAAIVDDWVRRGLISSRSALADARLIYGDPFSDQEWVKIMGHPRPIEDEKPLDEKDMTPEMREHHRYFQVVSVIGPKPMPPYYAPALDQKPDVTTPAGEHGFGMVTPGELNQTGDPDAASKSADYQAELKLWGEQFEATYARMFGGK